MDDIALPAVVETDERQMELFERSHSSETMSLDEFASWISENTGFGVGKVLQIAAFMLCCDVISQDIGKAKLQLREFLDNGTSRVVKPQEHPLAEMAALEPNRWHTWREFTEMMVYWGCLTSNSYAGVVRNRSGDPVSLIPFQSGHVHMKVNGSDVFYDVTAGTQFEMALLGAGMKTFPERDMVHARYRVIDGANGYSTLSAGRHTLDTSSAMDDFRKKLFGEQGQLRGVFTREGEGVLDEMAFQRLRQQFRILMSRFSAVNEPIVLEDGLKFDSISSNPQEMELSKQFEAQVNEVCRLLRVPPHKVFLMGAIKYDNWETADKAYLSETLEPRAEALEERMSKMLLSRKDRLRYFFQYDRSNMAIKDSKSETERAVKAYQFGGITTDEFRAMIGINPLDNGMGAYRLIPTNMTLIDENGNVVVGGQNLPKDGEPEAEGEAEEETQKAVLRLIK